MTKTFPFQTIQVVICNNSVKCKYSFNIEKQFKCCILICRFMQNTTTQDIRRAKTSFKKYTSQFICKGLCVRGRWRPNKTATLLWPSALSFSFYRVALWTCSHSSIFSPTGLVSKLNRGSEGPFCWVVAFPSTSCL